MQANQSHVRGATNAPPVDATIGAYLDQAVERHADNEALVVAHQGIRWNYSEFHQRVSNVAAGLLRLGLQPGERIGIWSQNCAEWVLTQFAAAKAGLVLVNVNPAYRSAELEYSLNKVGCRALILAAGFKTSNYIGMLQGLAPEIARSAPGNLHSARLPELRLVIRLGNETTPGMISFDDLLAPASGLELLALIALGVSLHSREAVNIQFTSGTTGAPKGATLSHRNLVNNAFFVGETIKLTAADRVCIPVPLYHCFGMVLGTLACVAHGSTMVLPGEGFEPRAVLETVQKERCTALYGVPTMFIAELDHPEFGRYDLSSLRTGIMAGAPCPVEVMRQVINRMHMREVTIAYGMTETAPVSFQSSVDDPFERRVSTVGRVHPHVEVKIVDEHGHTVPRGEKGELLTRGYSVMLGYWNDAPKTAEAIDAEGWMHTGDLATVDAEGYCRIIGRSKDMVIRGGENIFPREVEEFLYRHPAVLDVQCVGVPDARYGEELCACVILRPGEHSSEEEIRRFCRGTIAHYKIPRYVQFVADFPLTVTGKVQKFALRERMIAALALEEKVAA